ncbi:MAG: tetratricopeptide repeat protein [Rhodospirillaceae bacterium]
MTNDNDDLKQTLHEAVSCHQAGDLIEAERLYRRVLGEAPDHVDALNLLGVVAQQKGNLEDALSLFDRAMAAAPRLATIPFNKANALRDAERNEDAIALYKTALDLDSHYTDARLNLGALLHERGHTQAAVAQFNALLKDAPDSAKGYYNLGKCRQTQGRLEDATQAIGKAIELDPEDPEAYFAQANVVADMGLFEEAISHINKAIQLKPDWPEAYANWGNYLCDLDRQDESLTLYDQAINLNPPNETARANKAFALLTLGKMREGWLDYHRRPLIAATHAHESLEKIPTWRNENLSDKKVLVVGEQGIGDEILFASMIREFAELTEQCVLACSPKLLAVLEHSFSDVPNLRFVSKDDISSPINNIDLQATIIDIGQRCRPSLIKFPSPTSYLSSGKSQEDALRFRYKDLFGDRKPLVGISWTSSNPTIGAQKTIPLEDWLSVLECRSVQFVNVQSDCKQTDLDSIPSRIRDKVYTDPDLDITHDLLAALDQLAVMDLVITCSNTTAHLAGASGRPTWVLLPTGRARLWYWFKGQNPCPWYPNVKLMQKSVKSSWASMMKQVAEKLSAAHD